MNNSKINKQFLIDRDNRISKYSKNKEFRFLSNEWLYSSMENMYVYNFDWLSRPIIQNPIDIVAIQELIWKVKPDLIIETGIAHGGSLILSASMLALLDYSDAQQKGLMLDPTHSNRKVLGIDIEIREHNKVAIEEHPMYSLIEMIEGSSTDDKIINKVNNVSGDYDNVMIFLDSNHTHEHVLQELEAYAPFVTKNSYCVVFDTFVEDMSDNLFTDRPWSTGNNPKTAVWEYLKTHPEFEIDKSIQNKLLITVAPDGFLKKIK